MFSVYVLDDPVSRVLCTIVSLILSPYRILFPISPVKRVVTSVLVSHGVKIFLTTYSTLTR